MLKKSKKTDNANDIENKYEAEREAECNTEQECENEDEQGQETEAMNETENDLENALETETSIEPLASVPIEQLPLLLEAIILAAGRSITEDEILKLFVDVEKPSKKELNQALKDLQESCDNRGVSLVETASGYQFQVKLEWAPIIARLWEEKAPKYSRALFETLALIAYRQPITRGEIEEIRGVSLSLSIFKTLLEDREWIRVVGHKEVPGRPALYATTKQFLDYFGLKSLEELPSLPDIMNLDTVELQEQKLLEALKLANPAPHTEVVGENEKSGEKTSEVEILGTEETSEEKSVGTEVENMEMADDPGSAERAEIGHEESDDYVYFEDTENDLAEDLVFEDEDEDAHAGVDSESVEA